MGIDPVSLFSVAGGLGQGFGAAFSKPPQNTSLPSSAIGRGESSQAGVLSNPTITLGGDFNLLGGGARGASAQTSGGAFQTGQPVTTPNDGGFNLPGGINIQQVAIIAGVGLLAIIILKKMKKG